MRGKSRRTPSELIEIIRNSIPEGIVKAEHTADAHFYRHIPSGVLLPSVTTITGGTLGGGEHLKSWAARLATDYIEERIEHFKTLDMLGRQEIYKAAVLAHKDTLADAGGIGTEGHGVAESYIKEWIATGKQPAQITEYIKGEDYRLWAIARSAQKFFKDFYALPVAAELKVANVIGSGQNRHGYAGTMDSLMYLAFKIKPGNDSKCEHDLYSNPSYWYSFNCQRCYAVWEYQLCLVDWKTSNSIWQFPTPEGMMKQVKDDYAIQTVAYQKALFAMARITPKRIIIVRLDKAQEKYEIAEVYDWKGAYRAFLGLKAAFQYISAEHAKSATLQTKERISMNDL